MTQLSVAESLKVVSIFEIIVAALIGTLAPFAYIEYLSLGSHSDSKVKIDLDALPIFFLLKSLSCGVIIGVALLHLLPDASESLEGNFEYPVCFASAGFGIILCLVCEQFAMWIVSTAPPGPDVMHIRHDDFSFGANDGLLDDHVSSEAEITNANTMKNSSSSHSIKDLSRGSVSQDGDAVYSPPPAHSRKPSVGRRSSRTSRMSASGRAHSMNFVDRHSRAESSCEMGMVVHLFSNANDTKTLLKAYVLEAAIAVHSIIMGISLGSMTEENVSSIKILMIAYGVHQLLEGVSLGCAISATDLSFNKMAGLIMFFACTLPTGIVIGLLISDSTDSYLGEMITGFSNGIAAGILIYVSMIEMMAEEFSNPNVKNDYGLKAQMILCITVGMVSMAVLAIWA
jgi:zinc transporter ZupT